MTTEKTETENILGIRAIIEAIESGSTINKVYLQKGLRGELFYELNKLIKEKKIHSKLIMQVHDELVFDVFPWKEALLKKEIVQIMENIIDKKVVKLKVDIWEGKSWKETK